MDEFASDRQRISVTASSRADFAYILSPIIATFSNLTYFLKIDDLLARRHEESLLILDFKFNQTDPVGSMNHLCRGLEEVAESTRNQKVDILLEGDGRLSKAISCCFASLISDGENGPSMSHLVDIDGFLGNGKRGSGETREEFNEFHSDALGEGVFAIHFFGNGFQDVFRNFIHLDFSLFTEDFLSGELFFSAYR